jgi:hypothetical protein
MGPRILAGATPSASRNWCASMTRVRTANTRVQINPSTAALAN